MCVDAFLLARLAEQEQQPGECGPLLAAIADGQRRVVDRYRKAVHGVQQGDDDGAAQCALTLRAVICDLARPYRQHPDFDPRWADV